MGGIAMRPGLVETAADETEGATVVLLGVAVAAEAVRMEAAAATAEKGRNWGEQDAAEEEEAMQDEKESVGDRVGICPADAEIRGHGWSWWWKGRRRRPGKAARTAGHTGGRNY